METKSFHTDVEYNDNRPVSKMILETSFSKEIRILLKKGQVMKEHKAPFPIIVHVLKGAIDFGVEGTSTVLKEGAIIGLEGNVLHDLTALDDSMVRLTVLKADQLERVEGVAKS